MNRSKRVSFRYLAMQFFRLLVAFRRLHLQAGLETPIVELCPLRDSLCDTVLSFSLMQMS